MEFAKFNAALNGIHNVTFALGDLFHRWKAARLIASLRIRLTSRSSSRRKFSTAAARLERKLPSGSLLELPARLKPGGRLYCRTLGTERPSQSFEKRIREWLGREAAGVRCGFVRLANLGAAAICPRGNAEQEWRQGGICTVGEALYKERRARARDRHVIVFSRLDGQRPAFTLRRTIGSGTSAATLDWAMAGKRKCTEKEPCSGSCGPSLWLLLVSKSSCGTSLRDGEINPENFTLSIETPFATDCRVQPWMALLLPRCDGKTTVADLFEMAKQNGWIIPETPAEEFSRLLATLISGGFLQTEEFKLPAEAG